MIPARLGAFHTQAAPSIGRRGHPGRLGNSLRDGVNQQGVDRETGALDGELNELRGLKVVDAPASGMLQEKPAPPALFTRCKQNFESLPVMPSIHPR
jgi:hypothetical protein